MLIEINLLPREFRPKKRLLRVDYKFLLTVGIIIGALGLGGYYFQIKQSLTDVKQNHNFWIGQQRQMQGLIALNIEVKNLREKIEEKVNIIKELITESNTRLLMLEHVNFILPKNLWLMNIDESNQSGVITFTIEGMSYSKESISEFLAGLEKFEKFSLVTLESITPAPLEIRDAFNFIIEAGLASSEPAKESN